MISDDPIDIFLRETYRRSRLSEPGRAEAIDRIIQETFETKSLTAATERARDRRRNILSMAVAVVLLLAVLAWEHRTGPVSKDRYLVHAVAISEQIPPARSRVRGDDVFFTFRAKYRPISQGDDASIEVKGVTVP